MVSFAGESQARMRYTYFASAAKKEGYEQIAAIFMETADQEKEHAKRMFKWLEGGMVEITASYPAGVIGTTIENLKAAAAGEIDLFPMDASLRDRWANLWTLSPDELDQWGDSGLGRTAPLWEEVSVAGLTERFYDMAAAVRPDSSTLSDSRFAQALAAAIETLTSSAGEDARQLTQ